MPWKSIWPSFAVSLSITTFGGASWRSDEFCGKKWQEAKYTLPTVSPNCWTAASTRTISKGFDFRCLEWWIWWIIFDVVSYLAPGTWKTTRSEAEACSLPAFAHQRWYQVKLHRGSKDPKKNETKNNLSGFCQAKNDCHSVKTSQNLPIQFHQNDLFHHRFAWGVWHHRMLLGTWRDDTILVVMPRWSAAVVPYGYTHSSQHR